MELFRLLGTIVIGTTDASAAITALMNQVAELQAAINGIGPITIETGGDGPGDTTEEVEEVTTAVTEAGDAVVNGANTANRGWTVWRGILADLGTMAIRAAQNATEAFMETGYEYNANMELWREQLRNMLGLDLEGADAFLDKLHQFAIDTPYSMNEVMKNTVMLLGNRNVRDNVDIIELMTMIGNMSNGDNAAFGSLARGVMQVFAKGKVHAEEANQQFAERGVDVYQMLADYFNVIGRDDQWDWTSDDVIDLAANPSWMATAAEFYEALKHANFSEGGFYAGRMDAMMNTATGQAERMREAYQRTAGAVTKTFFDVFASDTIPAIRDILDRVHDWATEHPEVLANLADAFSNLAVNGVNILAESLMAVIELYAEHETELNALMVLLGGIAISAGHPIAGAALVATGAAAEYAAAASEGEERGIFTPENLYSDNEKMQEAATTGDASGLSNGEQFELWFNDNIGIPLINLIHHWFPGLTNVPDPRESHFPGDPGGGMSFGVPDDSGGENGWSYSFGADMPYDLFPGGIGGNNGINYMLTAFQAQQEAMQTLPERVATAVADGLSGMTITATVNQGNVQMDGSTVGRLVGAYVNIQLGRLLNQSGRG